MLQLTDLLAQGAGHGWWFIPTAIVLGALHGLEPGHSKTMMAAFIIAIRGTVRQAVLLGLSATLSHTLIVWVIALGGLYLWQGLAPETIEPWLQLASGVIIVAMALWLIRRTRQEQRLSAIGHDHHHGHDRNHDPGHHHGHAHDHQGAAPIDTGHGILWLSLEESGVAPHFRLESRNDRLPDASNVDLDIERPNGARQAFVLAHKAGALESVEPVMEPHDFNVRVTLRHGDHSHAYDVAFIEHDEGDDPIHAEWRGLDLTAGYQDAHELAHADDIRRRFADGKVTNSQIAIFGLTGGLIPCPGAITVLLLCLQLKAMALGAALVLSFSVGLALTMVTTGAIAALSVRQVARHFEGFGEIVRKAPYVSGVVIMAIGVYLGIGGWLAVNG